MTMRYLLTMLLLALPGVSPAADLTIRFTGTFEADTCRWSMDESNYTVMLDPIDVGDLPASGAAGFKTFSLKLDRCSPLLSSAVFTFGTNPDPDDALRYRNSGSAAGVAVELQSADGRTIGANGTDNTRSVVIVDAAATLDLRAAYWRLAGKTAGSGTVSSVATVTVTYP